MDSTTRKFEQLHITTLGRYIGPEWHQLFHGSDWPYAYGQYIPVDKRYSAALAYNWHWRAWFASSGTKQHPRPLPSKAA